MNYDIVNNSWNVLEQFCSSKEERKVETKSLSQSVLILYQNGFSLLVEDWLLEKLRQDLQNIFSPGFWKYFDNDMKDISCTNDAFVLAVNNLHQSLQPYVQLMQTVDCISEGFNSDAEKQRKLYSITERFIVLIKATQFYHMPQSFRSGVVWQFYSKAFKAFENSDHDEMAEDNDDGKDVHCNGSTNSNDCSCCQQILKYFDQLNSQLFSLGLLEHVCGEAITSIIHTKIQQHVKQCCQGEFEVSFLDKLEEWLNEKVVAWLTNICQSDSTSSSSAGTTVTKWTDRLQYFLYQTFAKLRIQELFNIIVEFPDSMKALEDLKMCLKKTDLRAHLIRSLRSDFETRLLHPGVNTADILTQYISSIRSLKVLDQSGVMLEIVCEPVRKYLRSREDTVRCIVSSLTDDSSSDLAEELIKAEPLQMDESYMSEEEEEDPSNWQPDPIDADPGNTSKSRRSSDIISTLVNIYGSRELFVSEYRTLLADRILTSFNFDTARELRYLELLKLRFGESQLHFCEVMLKDVADSKRINANIKEKQLEMEENDKNIEKRKEEEELDYNSLILSAQFWPNLKEEKLELPEAIKNAMDAYRTSYETLKGSRTLNWKTNIGLVNLDIELKNRKLSFSVSPIHATIIIHFQERAKWTIEELSSVMQVPGTALRRKIAFWQSQGVLKEDKEDTFVLVEEQQGHHGGEDVLMIDSDEEIESAMASAQDQKEEELQMFWTYIVGMLTNLESLPLERIHSMLKMFAMQGPTSSECSEQELRVFLDRKVRDQQLIYAGGIYRLPKTSS
ncbi:anaphase-promoting complex subunit 2-like [Anneissia japonica]|uniref:anaphase-promoting complex subunit 2-like n=1 Tax=Anneissia japonica TaxID=1529436 RepID=UPI001425A4C4|nr:anaphase-promoting complex subunit 2-like [Anneissia japonica]